MQSLLYEVPGGNQVGGLPPSAGNVPGDIAAVLEAKLRVASASFKRVVRAIIRSNFVKGLEEHALGAKGRSCISAVLVITMSADISCWTDFVT